MVIATSVKRLLHSYGIHSTTVQPEFVKKRLTVSTVTTSLKGKESSEIETTTESFIEYDSELADAECLLRCNADECNEQVCCPVDVTANTAKPGTSVAINSTESSAWIVSKSHGTNLPSPSTETQKFSFNGGKDNIAPFKMGKSDGGHAESSGHDDTHHHRHSHEHGGSGSHHH